LQIKSGGGHQLFIAVEHYAGKVCNANCKTNLQFATILSGFAESKALFSGFKLA